MIKDRLLDYAKVKFEIRNQMRYDDVGDYFDHTIVAYDFNDPVITNAIFLHEFIEYTLVTSAGLSSEMIDKFDTDPAFADEHPEEFALYRKFHDLANMVEKQFIENLGIDWEDHDRKINTVKVAVAVEQATDQLHVAEPSKQTMDESKKVVQENLKDQN